MNTLPTEPGFYWWRTEPRQKWRMVHVRQLGDVRPGGQPYLEACDVEFHRWSGRSLDLWVKFWPVGEWIHCPKPA